MVGILAILPAGRLLWEALAPRGTLDPDSLRRALSAPATWRATGRTLEVALAGTALSVVVGCAFAALVALTDVRGRAALVFAFMLPLMIAPQVTALAWSQAIGPNSVILGLVGLAPAPGAPNPLHSRVGIALLLGIQHAPLVFLAVRAGLRALPRELVEAAQGAGASPWRVARSVVLPLVLPAVGAGAVLAFVSAIGNFGIPAILGIPAGYTVLTTLIYQRLAGFGPAVLGDVAALSLVLGVLAVAGVAAGSRVTRTLDVRVATLAPARPAWRLGRARPLVEGACWLLLATLLVLPFLALLTTSVIPALGVPLHPGTATLEHYRYIILEHAATTRAFRNSFLLAGTAAILLALTAVPFGYFLVWRSTRLLRLMSGAAELPYALPGVVLAIALILVFLRPLPLVGIGLYGTPAILLIAYLARFLALALRPVTAGYLQLDRALEDAARMSGAGLAFRLRTVLFPLLAPVTAAAAILIFLMAFNELTVSALLWSAGAETLGVVVFSLEQAGDSVSAAAVSVLTVLATLSLMAAVSALARRLPPGVLPWQA